jgi:hypothetical protein
MGKLNLTRDNSHLTSEEKALIAALSQRMYTAFQEA